MWRKICRTSEERKEEAKCKSKVGGKRLDEFFFCKEHHEGLRDSSFEMNKADNSMRFFSARICDPSLTEKERIQARWDFEKAGDQWGKYYAECQQHRAILENCKYTIEVVENECNIKFQK